MSHVKSMIDGIYNKLLRWNNPYYDFGVASSEYERVNGKVSFHKLHFAGSEEAVQPVIKGYPYAAKIASSGGVFSISGGNEVMLDFEGLRFRINSAEELFIMFEVFLLGTYRFCSSRESVFMDIGMNAGIASLFYARDPNVRQVFSYELFKPTHELGLYNLRLNPEISLKVKSFGYGLSNRSFSTTLEYSLSRKGRMGLKGLPVDEKFEDTTRESVEVRDIAPVIKEIVDQSGGMDIIIKIDCEGEEFNLIDRLDDQQLFGYVSVIMLEWHYKRPDIIERRLMRAGFYVFSSVFPDLVSGMIYACRR